MGVLPSINLHCENISHYGGTPMGKICISMRGLCKLHSLSLFLSHRVLHTIPLNILLVLTGCVCGVGV